MPPSDQRRWVSLSALLLSATTALPGHQEDYNTGIRLSCYEIDLKRAWEAFSAVVKQEPQNAAALHCLGNLAVMNGQLNAAARYHGLAKVADPGVLPPLAVLYQKGDPCSGLADTYWVSSFAKKRLFDSIPATNSTQFDVHISMATHLEDSGLVDLAREHYRRAADLAPDDLGLRLRSALMVPVVYESEEHLESVRGILEASVARLLSEAEARRLGELKKLDQVSLPGTYYLVYQGAASDKALMEQIVRLYVLLYPRLAPPPPSELRSESLSGVDAKIRVGFVSAFFKRHSVCKLFCGIIAGLPRDRFSVTVFSSTTRKDDYTERLQASVDRFVDLPGGFAVSNREQVIAEQLHVLVFTDIGMESRATMWAHARLAPVQVATWGHPVTTGLPSMDYFVSSDLYEDSPAVDRYSEQLVRFDSLGFHFAVPDTHAGCTETEFRRRYGLQNHTGPIISCPQTLPKFHPSFDQALSRILAAVPEAVLVVVYDQVKSAWKDVLRERLSRRLRSPTQLIFVPNLKASEFSILLKMSRVILDPFPFGGGVTTLEALDVCAPVVTLPSKQTVPHLAGGMYRYAGFDGSLIARDEDEYVHLAVSLVNNATRRNSVRTDCRRQKRRLFSDQASVNEWATFVERVAKL